MARFLDPELQALLEAERRGARKASQVRPLVAVGGRPVAEGQWISRRTFGSGNRFPAQCARQGCPDRARIPTGQGLLTKSETGAWEVLHASCN